jgi:hypothetical protein
MIKPSFSKLKEPVRSACVAVRRGSAGMVPV